MITWNFVVVLLTDRCGYVPSLKKILIYLEAEQTSDHLQSISCCIISLHVCASKLYNNCNNNYITIVGHIFKTLLQI